MEITLKSVACYYLGYITDHYKAGELRNDLRARIFYCNLLIMFIFVTVHDRNISTKFYLISISIYKFASKQSTGFNINTIPFYSNKL